MPFQSHSQSVINLFRKKIKTQHNNHISEALLMWMQIFLVLIYLDFSWFLIVFQHFPFYEGYDNKLHRYGLTSDKYHRHCWFHYHKNSCLWFSSILARTVSSNLRKSQNLRFYKIGRGDFHNSSHNVLLWHALHDVGEKIKIHSFYLGDNNSHIWSRNTNVGPSKDLIVTNIWPTFQPNIFSRLEVMKLQMW